MNRERLNLLGKLTLAGALVTAGIGASEASAAEAKPIKSISCTTTDRWYGAKEGYVQGDRLAIKASAVVIPGDVTVDGEQQYDNIAETASVVGLKSIRNTDVTWQVNLDYGGSILVLPCKVGSTPFYTAVGREASVSDKRLGSNDPEASVDYNIVKK